MNAEHRSPYMSTEDYKFLKYVDDLIYEKADKKVFSDISVFRARIRVNPAVYKRLKTTGFLRDAGPCDLNTIKYLWQHRVEFEFDEELFK